MRGWRSLQGREETPEGCVPLRVLPGRFLRVLVGSTLFGTVPKRGRGLGLTPPNPPRVGRQGAPGSWHVGAAAGEARGGPTQTAPASTGRDLWGARGVRPAVGAATPTGR